MNGDRRCRSSGRRVTPRLLAAGALFAVGCGGNDRYHFAPATPLTGLPEVSFLALSDTQYAVPFTDYDVRYQLGKQVVELEPEVTTKWVTSFYRHAEAHFALPLALRQILSDEQKVGAQGRQRFGLFGGDMAEFSCKQETETILDLFLGQPKLPFIIAIGNHDAVFHGSYDTDAVGENGQGPWDIYSFALWGTVCKNLGGRLTKSGFIRQVLAYYEKAWSWNIHDALKLKQDAEYPLGVPLNGVVANAEWELAFAFRLVPDDLPGSHRQSYLYQRFTRRDPGQAKPLLTVTVLDTTDYGVRPSWCDPRSAPVQIGMAGAVSPNQVEWLEGRSIVLGPHFVLSHHIAFEAIDNVDRCETTFGTGCVGARLSKALAGATFVYGHVHKPLELEKLTKNEKCWADAGAGTCSWPLVRLPSLIDNKSYVTFENGTFKEKVLEAGPNLASAYPLERPHEPCEHRFLEYVELARNIRCFADQRRNVPFPACGSLESAYAAHKDEMAAICGDLSRQWTSEHASDWKQYRAEACENVDSSEHWRCILRFLSQRALDGANLATAEQGQLGRALLGAVHTLRR